MKTVFLAALLLIVSCKDSGVDESNPQQEVKTANVKFDKQRWKILKDDGYAYRDDMLHDLVYNVPLKGLNKQQVLDLLGEPNRIDNNHLFYTVDRKKLNFVTLNEKTLVLKLSDSGIVEWRKIKE